jgi:hypothetical protein
MVIVAQINLSAEDGAEESRDGKDDLPVGTSWQNAVADAALMAGGAAMAAARRTRVARRPGGGLSPWNACSLLPL